MAKKQELTYASAIAEIEEIMAQIESNELNIDKLTESVKRVTALIKFCKTKLYETEEEVNRVIKEIS
jgi:exodeoxyribonuclease VII small subunit